MEKNELPLNVSRYRFDSDRITHFRGVHLTEARMKSKSDNSDQGLLEIVPYYYEAGEKAHNDYDIDSDAEFIIETSIVSACLGYEPSTIGSLGSYEVAHKVLKAWDKMEAMQPHQTYKS